MNKLKKIIKEKEDIVKKSNMVRCATRIRPDQQYFIKSEARGRKMGEGQLHREIIDFYMQYNQ